MFRGALKMVSRLPLSLLYLMAGPLYILLYHILRIRRRTVVANLTRAFPDQGADQIRKITKRFYRHHAELLLEIVKALTIEPDKLRRRVRFANSELLNNCLRRGQSPLVIIAHYCNLEWLLLAGCLEFDHPVDVVYKPLKNRTADDLVLALRSRFGGRPIAAKNTAREIKNRLDITRVFAIVADQRPHRRHEQVMLQFLDQPTAFLLGAEKIALMTQYPVFFMAMRRIRRGHYEVTLQPLSQPPHAGDNDITQRYAHAVAALIYEQPADWLWSHRRWKPN